MTRLDWWIGILVVSAAITFHALLPRYELVPKKGVIARPLPNVELTTDVFRFDRWTGAVEAGTILGDHWVWYKLVNP
jgi:hypothetical protein